MFTADSAAKCSDLARIRILEDRKNALGERFGFVFDLIDDACYNGLGYMCVEIDATDSNDLLWLMEHLGYTIRETENGLKSKMDIWW